MSGLSYLEGYQRGLQDHEPLLRALKAIDAAWHDPRATPGELARRMHEIAERALFVHAGEEDSDD